MDSLSFKLNTGYGGEVGIVVRGKSTTMSQSQKSKVKSQKRDPEILKTSFFSFAFLEFLPCFFNEAGLKVSILKLSGFTLFSSKKVANGNACDPVENLGSFISIIHTSNAIIIVGEDHKTFICLVTEMAYY